eukprot:superscaffoldBa00008321_g23252
MEGMERVRVWSLQSPGDAVGKLSAGWTAAESWRAEQEEEEGEAFFGADTLIETRSSREIKAVRRLNERKKTAPVVYFVETKRESHLWKKVIELCFVSRLNGCEQIWLEVHC